MKLAWFQVQDARAVMLAGITTKLEWKVVNHATQAGTLLRLAYFSLTSVESAQQVNTMKIGHRKTVLSVQKGDTPVKKALIAWTTAKFA